MTRREILRLLAFTGVGLSNLGAMASFLSSCTHRRLSGYQLKEDKYGLTILVDGWRADMFRKMLFAGELPNIKKHLVDRGIIVENCIGAFPSTTGPTHLPFITGMMPGHNNCPGLRWIDRKNQQLRDYCCIESILFNNDFPQCNYTLYEMLSGERTTCIFDYASRGASEVFRPSLKTLWFIISKDMKAWEKMDENAVEIFRNIYLGGGTIPKYSFVWLPALDHISHFHGSLSEDVYRRALGVDQQIGIIMETLNRMQIYDKTIVSLVADHGLRDTEDNYDVRDILSRYGFKVLDNLSSNDNFNSLYQCNAARGVSGNGFALLYFARKKNIRGMWSYDWARPIEYEELRSFLIEGEGRLDLIELLRNEKPIKLVVVREKEDIYRVFSKDGHGKIERNYSSFRYSSEDFDPLGYAENPASAHLIDGAFHDKDTWFTATTETEYPDALFQISQLFDSERSGDIVVSSKPGCDLMNQRHIASHGGLEKAEMMIPCIIAGPGIKQGVIKQARSVDLYPTYLKYLGIPDYDGEVLNVFL